MKVLITTVVIDQNFAHSSVYSRVREIGDTNHLAFLIIEESRDAIETERRNNQSMAHTLKIGSVCHSILAL